MAAMLAADDEEEAAETIGGGGSGGVELLLQELRGGAAIWELPPQLECFQGERAAAKALAETLPGVPAAD